MIDVARFGRALRTGVSARIFWIAAIALILGWPARALAECAGGMEDGLCEPDKGDDCACDDCQTPCTGGCKMDSACTLEDACTCAECWSDPVCTDPQLKNCDDDGTCNFFLEGCCCADCAGLSNCAAFAGCEMGTGGSGTGGNGGSGGQGGHAGQGGSGLSAPGAGSCGCAVPGDAAPRTGLLGLAIAGLAIGLGARRRRVDRSGDA